MTNSDNEFGTHNKITHIYTQYDDGSTALINFSDVAEAKSYYFTDAALLVFDECCTELQWALTDANTLKQTMSFGVVEDAGTAGWGDQFNTRRQTLQDADEWVKETYPTFSTAPSEDHLF